MSQNLHLAVIVNNSQFQDGEFLIFTLVTGQSIINCATNSTLQNNSMISKVLITALLLGLALTQVVVQEPTTISDPLPSEAQSIPISQMTKAHLFVEHIVLQTILELQDSELSELTVQTDEESGNTTYSLTFIELDQNDQIIASTFVTVITADEEIYYIYKDGQFVDVANKQDHADQFVSPQPSGTTPIVGGGQRASPIVGGVSAVDTNNLSSIKTDALAFIKASVPKLDNWTLVSVTSQVVAGEINCFTFKDPQTKASEKYCVWSQPWMDNYMELTLPDGSKLTQGGVAPSNLQSNP